MRMVPISSKNTDYQAIQAVSILFFCQPVPYHCRGSDSLMPVTRQEEPVEDAPINKAPVLLRNLQMFSREKMERRVAPSLH